MTTKIFRSQDSDKDVLKKLQEAKEIIQSYNNDKNKIIKITNNYAATIIVFT